MVTGFQGDLNLARGRPGSCFLRRLRILGMGEGRRKFIKHKFGKEDLEPIPQITGLLR